MAFHIACPITCRRICFCVSGFPRSLHNNAFLNDVDALRQFLSFDTPTNTSTFQVAVPKVLPPPPNPAPDGGLPPSADAPPMDESTSMKAKRVALQRKGAATMLAAEEYAHRLESGVCGDTADTSGNLDGEQGQSNLKVFCRMCNRVENEGTERAKKMLSCKSCSKKYHRNCLRSWAQNRDLFHWSSWTCRACRICEACRRTGDPSKFMFCKRCDGAYHCYCLQPPHKNASNGPYLCPKHTRCHSCGSNVPGNGLSVRWFLGYTCCDACGRLFVKGNYCPVCLKVYRDSESTPMICCDVCQRWVHCHCDNISDEKYHQFQVDGNLQYKCLTCRGECHEIQGLEDAVQELWRRRNIADKDSIASLRAAAGLPTHDEIFSISPFSDDEDSGGGPLKFKSESERSFKFPLKNLSNDTPKKKNYVNKFSSKKTTKKKDSQSFLSGKIDTHHSFEAHCDARSLHSLDDGDIQSLRNDVYSSPAAGSQCQTEMSCPINQPGVLKHKFVDEVVSDEEKRPRVVRIKSNKAPIMNADGDKTQNVKGKKLVINLGSRKINVVSSAWSDTSCQRDQDLVTVNGNKYISQLRNGDKFALDRHDDTGSHFNGKGNRVDSGHSKVSGGERNLIKLGKVKPEVSEFIKASSRGNISDGSLERTHAFRSKCSTNGIFDQVGRVEAISRGERMTYLGKQSERNSDDETDDNHNLAPSVSLPKDSTPLLSFKLKKSSIDNLNSPHRDEEKTIIKGQRSKRKRPTPLKEKMFFYGAENVNQSHQDSPMDEIMAANWILMKLGNDAVGKRVEVHQPSDNSWHKGVVTDTVEGTSMIHVTLDDRKVKTLELRKQGVRFVPQKQKRSKT
ncbi:putative histone-lysine N-methyltransferase chromatin regulator PHD family [Lupinus albus]|uniref:Putative histone-lysine N-methyltransferase chromatin regulator PHD family n=1 Tax=Lupinus albus TaxID=3870 RepID=A0A6A4R0F1_LUPAL|nr:putative histone-lysine N-methyltransferase chromatin regulator PHD family [Lupinus albus]